MYHLYDSEGSDSEDEAERREKRERLAALEAKLKQEINADSSSTLLSVWSLCRAKEERKQQRYRAKSLYQKGVWNIHTVTMGGLGEDPDGSSSDEEGILLSAEMNDWSSFSLEDRESFKEFNEKASMCLVRFFTLLCCLNQG